MSDQMFFALQVLRTDKDSDRVFRAIKDRGTASGWMLAKILEVEPESISGPLRKLKEFGLVKSSGEGLDGYYHLSDLGFRLISSAAA